MHSEPSHQGSTKLTVIVNEDGRGKNHVQGIIKRMDIENNDAQGSPHHLGNGGKGIRTPGAVNPAVFKTAAIDHSAIPPQVIYHIQQGLKRGESLDYEIATAFALTRFVTLGLNWLWEPLHLLFMPV
jgi:hypothetical protein